MKRFELGDLYTTAAIRERINENKRFGFFVRKCIRRYMDCDWGDSYKEDKALNDEAVINGDRIFAAYIFPADNKKIWIITEADRSATTVLFPEDY